VTVLLVDGVRPDDGVTRPLALTGLAVPQLGDAWVDADAHDGLAVPVLAMLAVIDPAAEGDPVIVAPLNVAHPLGETAPVAVIPLALACPDADGREADGLGEARVDAVDEPTPEGLVVPTIDAVGESSPEGDPVTVCPLQLPPMLGETDPDHVFTVGVAWPDEDPHDALGVTVP